ncbi:MAG: ADP-ribosyl-[dinitrogen reductase] hydrolase [Desulfuromonadales bacterium]|nr:ADP-ribosyl-[dinitrogen reductase] hydrolase [Desulfuromonadales bacterium]MDW7758882.1 ADP-ribosyl-[dinitrogen reductase] hydrolase [Desulfuromonadales bacterium]
MTEQSSRAMEAILERARGAFLGVAIGDALGATTEFMTPAEITHRYGVHRKIIGGGWLGLKAGQVTDDTEMSLCIARAIEEAGTWDLTGIADQFVAWMRGKPVDIGATVRKGIRDYMLNGTIQRPQNDWDAGNGAVMRMAPVALYTLGDEDLFRRCTLEQAHLTHHHPLSDAACLAAGRMVQNALLGADRFEMHGETQQLCSEFPTFRFSTYRGRASGYVVETMQTVFHYLFTTATFEDCLIGVVNQGGDADTTGAIAGMIAGAFYGPTSIPARWLKQLDRATRMEVEEKAKKLTLLSPLAQRGF